MTNYFVNRVIKAALADNMNRVITPEVIREILIQVNKDFELNKLMNNKSVED